MPRRDLVPRRPEVRLLALEARNDQLVLGAKMAIEACLRDACPVDNQVDADRAYAGGGTSA
jgi:hypothetical protein